MFPLSAAGIFLCIVAVMCRIRFVPRARLRKREPKRTVLGEPVAFGEAAAVPTAPSIVRSLSKFHPAQGLLRITHFFQLSKGRQGWEETGQDPSKARARVTLLAGSSHKDPKKC